MNDDILNQIIQITKRIPLSVLERVVSQFDHSQGMSIREAKADFGSQSKVQELVDLLVTQKEFSIREVRIILKSILASQKEETASNLSLVWSGPDFIISPIRRTDQVILELIQKAESRLFISSFAVYKIQNILVALEAAIDRGIDISFLLETPQSGHFKINTDPFTVFSENIRQNAKFYIWPYKNRISDQDTLSGIVHAKFILQDSLKLFISSANLTGSALERNIELGVLIEDKRIISNLQNLLEELIIQNVITRI